MTESSKQPVPRAGYVWSFLFAPAFRPGPEVQPARRRPIGSEGEWDEVEESGVSDRRDRGSAAERRQDFRCGYCHGKVRPSQARIEKIRGVDQYVHTWHPRR